jgi:hypothetical protein
MVHDDGATDILAGGAGRDWFFASLDASRREVVTNIDLDA